MTLDVVALKAALEDVPATSRNGKCSLQTLVTEHPEAEEVIRAAVLDVKRSAARTAEILTRNGRSEERRVGKECS